MRFAELDARMRVFETAADYLVPPTVYLVARLDGRGFTRLTKELHPFEAPFDERFRDYMVTTAQHLMSCGFQVRYAYTQSDEISLLVAPDERLFGRKARKYLSILAGEASARFTSALGSVATFDCRLSQLPGVPDVVDYFRWRHEDAHRNALNAHCYWQLRRTGLDVEAATHHLRGLSTTAKTGLLLQHGIPFHNLPPWQKHGIGLYWEAYEKPGFNEVLHQPTTATRRRLTVNYELPLRDAYSTFIRYLLTETLLSTATDI